MTTYNIETIEHNGHSYLVEWHYDHDYGAPWEENDGHGEVSEWTRRDKKPGEIVLCENQGSRRFYDFAGAIARAKAEGWNTKPYQWKTKGEQAHAAVMADFDYLRRWCRSEWHYCGIVVTLLDEEGEETEISASLWGFESDADEYHKTVIDDLIQECEVEQARATYPVNTLGV